MKKKLISLLTAFSMTLMLFGSPNIAAQDTHTNHKVCGDLSCTDSGHTDISDWVGINSLSNLEDGKHYYLTQDITLNNKVTIDSGKDIKLCLNGYTITAGATSHCHIEVFSFEKALRRKPTQPFSFCHTPCGLQ